MYSVKTFLAISNISKMHPKEKGKTMEIHVKNLIKKELKQT